MSIGAMQDSKLKLRNLPASHALGCAIPAVMYNFSAHIL
jgi:hypothetical protein